MPGTASLAAVQYYAHPRNAFWPIMSRLCGFDADAPYGVRLAALRQRRIALWDVLQRCVRPGSLDSDIAPGSAEPNDFAAFFACHRRIRAVLCNGGTAYDLFRRRVLPELGAPYASLAVMRLPSTSPAHAGMDARTKLARWRAQLLPLLP
jgi:hypoxanthine-DNA glycosylase